MANQEHLEKLREGVEAWNQWREENPVLQPDLQGADLSEAQLQGINLNLAQLQGARLFLAQLQGATLISAQLQGAFLSLAHLQEAHLSRAQLQGAYLTEAQLQGADLWDAQLQGADLRKAQLQGAYLYKAQLQGAYLTEAQLQGAYLREAFFDNATSLREVILGDGKEKFALLADVSWGGVNLAVVDWSPLKMLGDEYQARYRPAVWMGMNDKANRLEDYRIAVRANRQLAVVLRDQGLNEEADRFAYRAQILQRKILWMQLGRWNWIEDVKDWLLAQQNWKRFLALCQWIQKSGVWKQVSMFGRWLYRIGLYVRKIGAFLFSFFLGLLAGYGYRPGRALFWYLFVIIGFSVAYATIGHLPAIPDALVFSLTSFHGRGFFPGIGNETSLHNPLVVLAAIEAVIGLFIEISFIATFTQRFFGR